MKAVILAGGLGSRLSEETELKPKPMVEIGGRPILWHIMKIYSHYGINDFVICCGYKGHLIKQYFADYFLHMSDVTFDLGSNKMKVHSVRSEPWTVTLVDTGTNTETGGRLLKVKRYLANDEIFHLTYGDGLADVDLHKLTSHHMAANCTATLSAVVPPGRFGAIAVDGHTVTNFMEKPSGHQGPVNGGFMVFSPKIFETLKEDRSLETFVLPELVKQRALSAYAHPNFWHPMDNIRDKRFLEDLWDQGKAPWKIWNEDLDGIQEKLIELIQATILLNEKAL